MKLTILGKPIRYDEAPIVALILINSFLLGATIGSMLYMAYA